MRPWFDAAQRLFHIHGEPDPLCDTPSPGLSPPHPPGAGDARIMETLRANGLHPYLLHSALRRLPGCRDCLGHKCPMPCKMDGRSAGVEPALATGNAALLTGCTVTRLIRQADGGVTVEARMAGETRGIWARQVVLAAGALSSPRILMASRSAADPDGIGNASGLVGRNLMFHLNEIFALWPGKAAGFAGPTKSVGFRDLYFADGSAAWHGAGHGHRCGLWRDRASPAGRVGPIMAAPCARRAGCDADSGGDRREGDGHRQGLCRAAGGSALRGKPGAAGWRGIALDYRTAPELLARRKTFRRLIRRAFRGTRTAFLTHEPEPNFGHPCGTLRMGVDVGDSVVNRAGRVHGVANLWVTDASVFPTSMGVNPSLTIAANALRVAEEIRRAR